MKLQDLIPNVTYSNKYVFKDIFYKYHLATDIEDKYLQVYRISDGETLEDISYQIYNDPIYFWTIIIVNDLYDPIFDLPLPEDSIQEIARDLATGDDGEIDDAVYITKYDELTESNDAKREIKVIKREYLSEFLTKMIRQSVNS
jgi:hypothetical protein